MSEFLPKMDFRPFTGEIEDNKDPLMLGRVRVRAHGYHSQDLDAIPTKDLPWAFLAYSRSDAVIVPEIGEWVFGYFLDGDERQKPMVVGIIPGVVDEEPTTNRRARNEKVDETDIFTKKGEIIEHGNLTEPDSPYDAKYPTNHSFLTPAGHLIEVDDTEGAERIHIYHKSGSFEEYHSDGKRVQKTENDNYEANKTNKYTITLGNNESSTKGNDTKRTDGNIEHSFGGTLKFESDTGASMEFDQTGLVQMKNNSHSLAAVLNDLLDELIALQTVGSPANHVVNPTNIANLVAQKAKLATFLK